MTKRRTIATVAGIASISALAFIAVRVAPDADKKPAQVSSSSAEQARITATNVPSPTLSAVSGDNLSALRDLQGYVAQRSGAKDSYDQLALAANAGNAFAAYQLAQDMRRCNTIEQRVEAADLIELGPGASSLGNIAEATLKSDLSWCKGITPEQAAAASEWTIRAARLGSVDGKLEFARAALEKYQDPADAVRYAEEIQAIKRESISHLRDAAQLGNRTAMIELATAYQGGTLAKKDPVRAYAYLLAAQKHHPSRNIQAMLDMWGSDLPPSSLARARQIASQLNGKGQ